ncbi:hypothetical protein OEZ85_006578 [Tetradesmus obliquus]|uniref:Uncharacterized protein n=1 Tax=Tetradesmus obliquus TaxID=3088 RepID=A0ABY8TVS3_TETOB|nr:hypothetical protein OEZ85_006578 [Tetradesmus obliquus]
MEQIEPDHFDVVVVSSGLPEVLIGSALARAGKSVLLLDSTESYGGSWATLSGPDYVHSLINRQLQHQLSAKQQQQQQQQQEQQEQQQRQRAAPSPDGAGSSCSSMSSIALQAVQPLAGVSGVSLYTHADVEPALENKQLLMDLAPRVLYQDEPLVDLLVACQAHHYLEFKLVEGSYIYLSGKLRPVPASRAELFADKALPLASKRCLGRFLAGCLEAQQGAGRLQDAFDARPLVELLAAEGLDEQLQQ